MFTIRTINAFGQSSLFQAHHVVQEQNAEPELSFYNADYGRAHESLSFGRVYVMNESGKTVADFTLGDWRRIAGENSKSDAMTQAHAEAIELRV